MQLGGNKYILAGDRQGVLDPLRFPFVHTGSGSVWGYAYGIDAESSTFVVECFPKRGPASALTPCRHKDPLSLLEKISNAIWMVISWSGRSVTPRTFDG